MKYIHIIIFLMKHDLTFLKKCWEVETIYKKFSWSRIVRYTLKKRNRYLFWFRLANEMFLYGDAHQKRYSQIINEEITIKYGVEIGLGAIIGENLTISHYSGVIITSIAIIGKNAIIKQNTTIGIKTSLDGKITIGDNFHIGTGSCIIADALTIGDNVMIGAMSFVNKDIPDNSTVYTKKLNILTIT